jgi:Co/Zn/Cd efflux system component
MLRRVESAIFLGEWLVPTLRLEYNFSFSSFPIDRQHNPKMNSTKDAAAPVLDQGLRRAVAIVASLNIAYFGVEFVVALAIGSVSLFADSVDFLEDASINLLIFAALRWSARRRARVGMTLAGILLLPALAFVWALWSKFQHPIPPAPGPLTITGIGALAVNLSCAFLLVRFRHHKGSLTRAAFLSARNDALANVAIIGAGLLTLAFPSVWPDVLVGLGIAYMNVDAAKEVWTAARSEHRKAVGRRE